MRRSWRMLACVFVLGAIAAPPAEAAPTRAEYIAQVDPICQQKSRDFKRASHAFNRKIRAGEYRAAAARFERLVKIFARSVDQIAAVEPPTADAQLVGDWIAGLKAQTPLAKRIPPPVRAGKLKIAARRLGQLQKLGRKTQALVAGYGFRHCDEA